MNTPLIIGLALAVCDVIVVLVLGIFQKIDESEDKK